MNDPLLGTLFARRFQIEALLGAGGMGAVYLARHEVLHRRLALKVIRREMLDDLDVANRFRREARAASRVDHPNIIQIVDFGEAEDGRLYLAMEYVDGPTLTHVLRKQGRFTVDRALWLLDQMADALVAAHTADVVHRDLKPINIVLTTPPGGEEQIKILDFGLAKILDPFATAGLSTHGQLFGTPEYMSPERCMDAPADHRTDLYSLGIIAFELLVGHPPFSGRVVQTLTAHLSQPPPAPSDAAGRSDIPLALDALILRCLAKKPDDRFRSAADLQQALRGLFDEEKTRPREQRLQETLAPLDPTAGTHDTIIMRRRPPTSEHTAISHDLQTMEDLVYALRDRRLGTPEITCQLALLLDVRDQQLMLRSMLQMLQHQLEELQMTARIRASKLTQLLSQLTHELDTAQDARSPLAHALRLREQAVTGRIQQIGVDLAHQETEVRARMEHTQQSLSQLMGSLQQCANNLWELIRPVTGRLDLSGDPELAQLLVAAGPS